MIASRVRRDVRAFGLARGATTAIMENLTLGCAVWGRHLTR
jgi:hypothetical protein